MNIEGQLTEAQIYKEEIFLADRAVDEIKVIREKNNIPTNHGLRISVKGGGCSGLTYVLAYDENSTDSDHVFELKGQKVFIDQKSMFYLAGTTLDFSDGLNGKGFVFQNPQATKTCGCGTSFGV
ncbi:MAG: iron-sulfur cluster assembly accessory protein [Ignavibacteria bacterium]|nr:iron-sulfur cluster assembly accessory protein [Bacteroidota bacterium]MSQ46098.1 iron-sulfur cluster assembly accessory protein [Ignavibacteria bacterium]